LEKQLRIQVAKETIKREHKAAEKHARKEEEKQARDAEKQEMESLKKQVKDMGITLKLEQMNTVEADRLRKIQLEVTKRELEELREQGEINQRHMEDMEKQLEVTKRELEELREQGEINQRRQHAQRHRSEQIMRREAEAAQLLAAAKKKDKK
jgi:hypothetical protein